jgi:hypothetical protein
MSDWLEVVEGENMRDLNLSNFAKGMYFLNIEKEELGLQTIRIMIE